MSDSLATPWTVACQVPLSIEFSRQEYWSGLLFPTSGHLPESGIKPVISCSGRHWQVDFFLPLSHQGNDAGLNSFTSEHQLSICKMKILYTLQGCWEG